jgi:hypothetical protein
MNRRSCVLSSHVLCLTLERSRDETGLRRRLFDLAILRTGCPVNLDR